MAITENRQNVFVDFSYLKRSRLKNSKHWYDRFTSLQWFYQDVRLSSFNIYGVFRACGRFLSSRKTMSDKQESNGKGTANITDQEHEWAQQALTDYERKNYKACLQHLERIEEARPNDPKVLLNKAIVEFYDSGLCTTDKFQKSFVDVCKQVWLLCHLIPVPSV